MKQLLIILVFSIACVSCAQSSDEIIGTWKVKNDYYEAVYEVVKYKGKFFGKIHYYNDGKEIYKGNNKKEDYFLTGVERKGKKYIKGKMYLPGGTYYEVVITLKNKDILKVLMTVEGEPYEEVWRRVINK